MTLTTNATRITRLRWPAAAKELYGLNFFGYSAIGRSHGFSAILDHFGKSLEEYRAKVRDVCKPHSDYCGICGESQKRVDHFETAPRDCLGPRPRRDWIRNKWVIVTPPHWMTNREEAGA